MTRLIQMDQMQETSMVCFLNMTWNPILTTIQSLAWFNPGVFLLLYETLDVLGIITEISAIKPVGNAHIPSSYNRHVLIKNLRLILYNIKHPYYLILLFCILVVDSSLLNKHYISHTLHAYFKIVSQRHILKITLWGKRAQEFSLTNTYDPQKQTPIVVLFVGCLPKEYQGAQIQLFLIAFLASYTSYLHLF